MLLLDEAKDTDEEVMDAESADTGMTDAEEKVAAVDKEETLVLRPAKPGMT